MNDNVETPGPTSKAGNPLVEVIGFLAAFLVVAGLFIMNAWGNPDEFAAVEKIELSEVMPEPVRELHDMMRYDGDMCSDCHDPEMVPEEDPVKFVDSHEEVVLEHGINERCFNCHHPTNRDALIDHSGREIEFKNVEQLCWKCHGPTYRDWVNGAHGLSQGHWDQEKGERHTRLCIECHDPHAPKFKAMKPLPGPQYRHETHEEPHHD